MNSVCFLRAVRFFNLSVSAKDNILAVKEVSVLPFLSVKGQKLLVVEELFSPLKLI
jgi:hypothetical protein